MKKAVLMLLAAGVLAAPSAPKSAVSRAKELRAFIQSERANFRQREIERRDALDELDRLNHEQNQVRERIQTINQNHQEMAMALDNLSMEVQKQRTVEAAQKRRLLLFLKVVYKIKKDGLVRFAARGEDLSNIANRMRLLYHALRSHSVITKQLEERAARLAQGEQRLSVAKSEVVKLLDELAEQEALLSDLLKKKKAMLHALNQQQHYYHTAMREYQEMSAHLSTLFDSFEATREPSAKLVPSRATLDAPLEFGRLLKPFGKSVHEKFHTVTYHKGIEIAAEQNTEVRAILPGVVEYEGWLRGMGNVIIIHHGGGFYSLSDHLFKSLKGQGNQVEKGEAIGLVGDTGNNEAPSLYFELRENGKAVDPLAYLSPAEIQKLR